MSVVGSRAGLKLQDDVAGAGSAWAPLRFDVSIVGIELFRGRRESPWVRDSIASSIVGEPSSPRRYESIFGLAW